jgi:hypothetical protein
MTALLVIVLAFALAECHLWWSRKKVLMWLTIRSKSDAPNPYCIYIWHIKCCASTRCNSAWGELCICDIAVSTSCNFTHLSLLYAHTQRVSCRLLQECRQDRIYMFAACRTVQGADTSVLLLHCIDHSVWTLLCCRQMTSSARRCLACLHTH